MTPQTPAHHECTASHWISSLIFFLMLTLASCGSGEQSQPEQKEPAAAPPSPRVSVASVLYEEIVEWHEYTGRLESPQTVILRPRVSGYIDEVTFEEGAMVEKGQVLFRIDPDSYELEVTRLRGELKQAEAQLKLATQNLERSRGVTVKKVISVEELDTRTAAKTEAESALVATRAALNTALLNLSYTRVKAPISGRVSRADITAGNYVTAGESELTTLVSTDKVYAYFDADENAYLQFKNRHHGNTDDALNQSIPVFMRLLNEDGFPHRGSINFVDNRVNPDTGTIRARGVFMNENNAFTPGLFAHVRVAGTAPHKAILISDRAIGTDLNNKYVMIIDADNHAQYRRIRLGPKQDGMRIVHEGLEEGDVIVLEGLQRIRPGASVQPEKIAMFSDSILAHLDHSQSRLERMQADNSEAETSTPLSRHNRAAAATTSKEPRS